VVTLRNSMTLPFQCIEAHSALGDEQNEWVLFGASGSKLVIQSSDGASSVWPAEGRTARVGLSVDSFPVKACIDIFW
jgi:hypothetical protein